MSDPRGSLHEPQRVVLKFPAPHRDRFITVTEGATVVLADHQEGVPTLWVEMDPEATPVEWHVLSVATGEFDRIERLSETYDALVANSSAEHQRMSELCHALSTNVIRLDEQHERDAATIDYWKGQFERREDDYARLYAQAEDIKEQYRDCASELAASRRHLAAAEAEAKDLRLVMHTTGQLLYLEQQRWQEMAELLWEELQEWHAENCGQADDGTPIGAPCTCHRILAAKWDEITNADDWADDEPVDNDHA